MLIHHMQRNPTAVNVTFIKWPRIILTSPWALRPLYHTTTPFLLVKIHPRHAIPVVNSQQGDGDEQIFVIRKRLFHYQYALT